VAVAAMKGKLITFEGTEGSGKSTQQRILAGRLEEGGWKVRIVREPGGTLIGEEIRHTLKHSEGNRAMAAETELLLMNASRAQLVREVIRPALAMGEVVLCDRFYDSTVVYQGYGRGLEMGMVRQIVDVAAGETRPDLTILLAISIEVSEARRVGRSREREGGTGKFVRDRFEEADREFFRRVEEGYKVIAREEPWRVRVIDGGGTVEEVFEAVWGEVKKVIRKE
jgi:dTMP kinase